MMEWYIQIFIFHSTSQTTAESALLVTLNTTQRMDDAPGPRINNQLSIWLISHQLKRLGPVGAAGWRQLWSGSGGPRLADQRNGRLPNGLLADSERSCPAASFPATAVSPFPIRRCPLLVASPRPGLLRPPVLPVQKFWPFPGSNRSLPRNSSATTRASTASSLHWHCRTGQLGVPWAARCATSLSWTMPVIQ